MRYETCPEKCGLTMGCAVCNPIMQTQVYVHQLPAPEDVPRAVRGPLEVLRDMEERIAVMEQRVKELRRILEKDQYLQTPKPIPGGGWPTDP